MAGKKNKPDDDGSGRALMIGLAGAILVIGGYAAFALYGEGVPSPEEQAQAEVRMAAKGKQIYADNCASCHGDKLQGEAVDWKQKKPDGTLFAPPHDATGHTWHHPDGILFKITKNGGQAAAPPGFKSNMPPFGEILSDDEIRAVLTFIKQSWPPEIRERQTRMSQQAG
ncbi:MAG: cytochrome c [Rhodospirillales bacterium]|nr:cytochrome c [Rhodospirillales bacterium]